MANAIQVVIVANQDGLLQTLAQLLHQLKNVEILCEINNIQEVMSKLEVITPDIVLIDVSETNRNLVPIIEQLNARFPRLPVVVLSANEHAEEVRRFMRAGAKDYLFLPVTVEELQHELCQVHLSEQTRQSRDAVAFLSEHSTRQCCLVSFLSAKGGVGKTTLAVNTAAALARQGKRTALVDLDLQFGDTSLFLNLKPEKSIINLLRDLHDYDPEVIERYMTPHESGVMLLPNGSRPEEAEYVTGADIRILLQALRKRFDYVIVDTAPVANDIFFAVLETVDELLLVSTLNLAVLKNNRLLLDLLGELDYDVARVKHVVNRINAKNGLKIRDATKILKGDVYCEVDNDFKFVETTANAGQLFVLKSPQHKLSKQIYALTAKLDTAHGGRVSRRNPLLKRWLNGSSS